MTSYFKVNASKYDSEKSFIVDKPSSLNAPKDNSVMFITAEHMDKWQNLLNVNNCIIFWPEEFSVPHEIRKDNVIVQHSNPRLGYALFYRENDIVNNVMPVEFELVNGAFIARGARIGNNTVIFPGAYIDATVSIGDDCYIASGVKLIGKVVIGNNVVIHENTVIGSDGMTRMRDNEGKVATIPQFGGVRIEDNVQIGALTVVSRGAIDDTIIQSGCRIDNSCFISHNVNIGTDTIIVGETIMFGSSSTGSQAFISGNTTIRDGVYIGEKSFIGMGSNVICNVEDNCEYFGNPARKEE